jgi:cyclopropane-fatty-acyl-phospholipid synthase
MAGQKDLDYMYTLIDKIFRFNFGETGDFSGAMYNGDFSIPLEEAQRRKHEFIAENLNIEAGSRVLDMGCGWGPFLNFVRENGARGIGVTLSTGQENACKKNGLNVKLMDCRTIKPETFGIFDAVVSLGAFEHHCSREEWKAGKQDEVYNNFFKVVSDLLQVKKRFFLQTMTFGKNMIEAEEIDLNADKDSDAYIVAHLEKVFPGSWLPSGKEQIIKDAKPFFKLISCSNGRLDYIETQKQWLKKFKGFGFRKYLFYLSLIPGYLTNKNLRKRLDNRGRGSNTKCFEREIIDHYRFVFEKVS